MTDLTSPPRRRSMTPSAPPPTRPARDDIAPRPPLVTAVLAVLTVAGAGLVVCCGLAVVAWLPTEGGSATAAVRAGSGVWLAGHGSGVAVGDVRIDLVPLGLPILAALALSGLLRRLAPSTRLDSRGGLGALVAATTVGYAAVSAGVALLSSGGDVTFDPVRAVVGAAVVALLGCALGLRRTEVVRAAAGALPGWLRDAWVGARSALVLTLAAATLLTLVRVVDAWAEVVTVLDSLDPGLVGGTVLVVACLLLLPVAVAWTVALLLGPGFVVGGGTSVDVVVVDLGAVPALPLAGALPDSGPQPAWVVALCVLPLLAGVWGGGRSVRGRDDLGAGGVLARGSLAGLLAGLALGALLLVAGGAAGPGRLEQVGPDPWALPLALVVLGLGATVGACGWHYRVRRSGRGDDAAA